MLHDIEDKAILDLAEILLKNQTDKETIVRALEFVCNRSLFPNGMIYELDDFEQFFLMEHHTANFDACKKNFFINKFTLKERMHIAREKVTYIKKSDQNTPLETKLLDIYTAESLLIAPVVDENWYIYGWVVLMDTKPTDSIDESNLNKIFIMLLMIVRYVSLRMYRKKLNQAQQSLESILDNTGIDIYVNDFHNHDILYVNKSMAAPYGGQSQFVGKKCWQVLFPGQSGPCQFCPEDKLIDDKGNPTKIYSWDYQRPFDGSWFRVFSAAFRWIDGRLAHVISSADITDNKRNEALVENLANYDQLTKLPNRRMLIKECEHRIDKATATEQGYLLFFDIDGFKAVNDTLGHDAGDELLVQLGEFFSGIPLLKDAIYRNGGDEFVAIIGGETITKANIQSLANFIHARFNKVWHLKKGEIRCNTSIGVACYPEDGVTADKLLQKADMAMYRVKKSGGGGVCFGYQLDAEQ